MGVTVGKLVSAEAAMDVYLSETTVELPFEIRQPLPGGGGRRTARAGITGRTVAGAAGAFHSHLALGVGRARDAGWAENGRADNPPEPRLGGTRAGRDGGVILAAVATGRRKALDPTDGEAISPAPLLGIARGRAHPTGPPPPVPIELLEGAPNIEAELQNLLAQREMARRRERARETDDYAGEIGETGDTRVTPALSEDGERLEDAGVTAPAIGPARHPKFSLAGSLKALGMGCRSMVRRPGRAVQVMKPRLARLRDRLSGVVRHDEGAQILHRVRHLFPASNRSRTVFLGGAGLALLTAGVLAWAFVFPHEWGQNAASVPGRVGADEQGALRVARDPIPSLRSVPGSAVRRPVGGSPGSRLSAIEALPTGVKDRVSEARTQAAPTGGNGRKSPVAHDGAGRVHSGASTRLPDVGGVVGVLVWADIAGTVGPAPGVVGHPGRPGALDGRGISSRETAYRHGAGTPRNVERGAVSRLAQVHDRGPTNVTAGPGRVGAPMRPAERRTLNRFPRLRLWVERGKEAEAAHAWAEAAEDYARALTLARRHRQPGLARWISGHLGLVNLAMGRDLLVNVRSEQDCRQALRLFLDAYDRGFDGEYNRGNIALASACIEGDASSPAMVSRDIDWIPEEIEPFDRAAPASVSAPVEVEDIWVAALTAR